MVETFECKSPETINFLALRDDPLDTVRGFANGILLGLASWLVMAALWIAGNAVTGLTLATW